MKVNACTCLHYITKNSPCYVSIQHMQSGKYLSYSNNKLSYDDSPHAFVIAPNYDLNTFNLIYRDCQLYSKLQCIGHLQNNALACTIIRGDNNCLSLGDGIIYFANTNELWLIQNINNTIAIRPKNIRKDYVIELDGLITQSSKNIINLLKQRYISFLNARTKTYLSVSVSENDVSACSSTSPYGFILVPNYDDSTVQLYDTVTKLYVVTLPQCKDVLMGLNCPWSHFYLLRENSNYVFRCIHDEYSRHLAMSDKGEVFSNELADNINSHWILKLF